MSTHCRQARTSSSSHIRLLIVLALCALALAACEIRLDFRVEVEADESGSVAYFVGVDDELKELIAQSGGEDPIGDLSDPPEGWTAREAVEDGFEGVWITATFESLAELDQLLTDLGGGEEGGDAADIEVTREAERFDFRADVSGTADEVSEVLGITDEDEADALLADLFDIRYEVVLPGQIEDANADRVDKSTLTWQLGLEDERSILFATSTAGSPLLFAASNVEYTLSVLDDGSFELAFDLQFLGQTDGDTAQRAEAALRELEDLMPSGWDLDGVPQGLSDGVHFKAEASSESRVLRLLERLGEATGLEPVTGHIADMSLEQDGNEYRLEAEIAPPEESLSVFLPEQPNVSLVVTMPGEVSEHNADEVEEAQLVWNLGTAEDAEFTASVVSSAGGSSVLLLAIIAAVVLLAGLAVVGVFGRSRHNRPDREESEAHFCRKCGVALQPGAKFCAKCGAVADDSGSM